ncbi:hypothetical protein PG994_003852 [Apiospora phragmitis]|uniref:Uncharacterized protein n=1 Tax=Apiospora phragmitis TaxID=2905665 RepID=A0ABR1W293_9PEZI
MDVHKTPQPSRYQIAKATAKPDRPQPWTASRCHRLLRPLLSRLALLRKELTSLPEPAAVVANDLSTTTTTKEEGRRKSGGKRQSSDCQWMLPRKKMRHTYAQQQKSAERQNSGSGSGSCSETAQQPLSIKLRAARYLQGADDDVPAPGEAVAFTPLVRRARGQEVPSPANVSQFRSSQGSKSLQTRRRKAGASKLEDRLAGLKSQVSASRYNDYESIFRSLEALLKGTAPEEDKKTKGAPSLLDMCLKKMPWYIAGVQAWELDEAEQNGTKSAFNSTDTSLRLYNELETLGASQQGWSHLRTVARADGIAAVREAMLEGLLNDDFGMLAIDLCTEYEAVAEAEALIEVFVQRQYPSPSGADAAFTDNDALRPLSFLWDFSIGYTRHSFLLRQYTMLLANGFLPVDWLVTGSFERVWGLAHRVLSREPAGSQQNIALISQNITYTFLGCLMEVEGRKRRSSNMARDLLYLAAFLASSSSLRTERVHSRLVNAFELSLGASPPNGGKADVSTQDSVQHYSGMTSLISKIAQICGRGSTEAPYQHLECLCRDLQLLGLEESMMDSITRVGALFLAQQTSNLRDLVYREPTNEGGHKHRQRAATTITDLLLGYRWEETISEWVVVSPVATRKKQAQHRRSSRFQRSNSIARKRESTGTSRDGSPPLPAAARPAGPTGRPASGTLTEPVPDSLAKLGSENARGEQAGNRSEQSPDDTESHRCYQTLQPMQCNLLNKSTTSHNRRCSIRPTTKALATGASHDDELSCGDEKENVNAQAVPAVRSKAKGGSS